MTFSLFGCDNDSNGIDPNYPTEPSLTGVFIAYRDVDFPAPSRVKIWAAIYSNFITISFSEEHHNVFQFSRYDDYYTGQSFRETIFFSLTGDFLTVRLVSAVGMEDNLQFERNHAIQYVDNWSKQLVVPMNFHYSSNVIGWGAMPNVGLLGAGIEIRCDGTQEFKQISMVAPEFLMLPGEGLALYLFNVHFSTLNLTEGSHTLRITHIGGPFFFGDKIMVSISSQPSYINLTVDAEGNIIIEMET